MTQPYFHDGSVKSLAELVQIKAKMQMASELSKPDADATVSFLGSPTGDLPEKFASALVLPPSNFSVGAKQ